MLISIRLMCFYINKTSFSQSEPPGFPSTCSSVMAYVLWTVFTWTVQGILCTCRFLWVSPLTWDYDNLFIPLVSPFGPVFFVHSPQAMCCFALQICPYNAIKFLPRQQRITGNPSRVLKQPLGKTFVNKNTQYFFAIDVS